jgi:hypothetical protein
MHRFIFGFLINSSSFKRLSHFNIQISLEYNPSVSNIFPNYWKFNEKTQINSRSLVCSVKCVSFPTVGYIFNNKCIITVQEVYRTAKKISEDMRYPNPSITPTQSCQM